MLFSAHIIPEHWSGQDEVHVRHWQPKSLKIVDPNVMWLNRVHDLSQNSLYTIRNHPMSEQHREMSLNPVLTGENHARFWFSWYQNYRDILNIPLDQMVFEGINEPNVWGYADDKTPPDWADDETTVRIPGGVQVSKRTAWAIKSTVTYYATFLNTMAGFGMRGVGLSIGVGWPADYGTPESPVNWEPYEPVHAALRAFPGHFLGLHEYWGDKGPLGERWGWWAGRYLQCPWRVPIIINECGLDMLVKDPSVDQDKRGWRNVLPDAQTYMSQIWEYEGEIRKDERIHSAQIFTWDGTTEDWWTFWMQELIPMFPTNDEFDNGYAPIPPEPTTPVEETAINLAKENQCIYVNPEAALQKAILEDGRIITGPEYSWVQDGKSYVGQRGEDPDRQPWAYYVEVGDWENVEAVEFDPE
jgi:hypothetical protein